MSATFIGYARLEEMLGGRDTRGYPLYLLSYSVDTPTSEPSLATRWHYIIVQRIFPEGIRYWLAPTGCYEILSHRGPMNEEAHRLIIERTNDFATQLLAWLKRQTRKSAEAATVAIPKDLKLLHGVYDPFQFNKETNRFELIPEDRGQRADDRRQTASPEVNNHGHSERSVTQSKNPVDPPATDTAPTTADEP